jgi:DNA phosphorothioation system restriction enzyme
VDLHHLPPFRALLARRARLAASTSAMSEATRSAIRRSQKVRLTRVSLSQAYRSSTHRIGRDFLGTLLDAASAYDRAAAFFSSTVFTVAPEAFVEFFTRGGRMRLVCSPILHGEDVQALARGVFDHPRVLRAFGTVEQVAKGGVTPDLLSLLVASGALDVRIAVPTGVVQAIYHEKIGLFRDKHGGTVAFSGSPNESRTAWSQNFERVDAFASWTQGDDRFRASAIAQNFSDLWFNRTDNVAVYDLADAFRRRLLESRDAHLSAPDVPPPSAQPPAAVLPEVLRQPSDIHLRPHQEEAIRAWAEAGGRGLLEMATGSGKTIAALALAARLKMRIPGGFVVVVVAPFIHLVDQWCEVARRFGLQPIRCAESRSRWESDLRWAVNAVNAGVRPVLSVATTAATLGTPAFQELIARITVPVLIIADEAHNYGAPSTLAMLPTNANFRLGLSATPDRWMDEPGTAALLGYFGPVVYRYGLSEAIRDEVLTPYRYYPLLVQLDPDELETYLEISRQLVRYLVLDDKDGPVGELALRLLMKRARLLGAARGKLPLLKSLLAERTRDTHILVYCGDGQVEGPDPGEHARQVEEAVRIIGTELKMRCASYTAATPPDRRLQLLKSFEAGDLQVLVAIRCLDEGVDIPATRTAYILASSTNPRQFIQRRGRVLRRSPGKTRAQIYDFLVVPDVEDVPAHVPEYPVVRRLLLNEFRRAGEFAQLAENGPVARQQLLDLTSHFQLFTALHPSSPFDQE